MLGAARKGESPSVDGFQDLCVIEWDVVQYQVNEPSESKSSRLGRVVSVGEEMCLVEPLAEQSEGVWVLDEEFVEPETIALTSICRVMDAEYGQRVVEDRCAVYRQHITS